jgi:hypothetical protein
VARLTGMDVALPGLSLSDRLSQWLDWNHALALSTALERGVSSDADDVPTVEGVAQCECARIRAIQVEAIAADSGRNGIGPSRDRKVAAEDESRSEAIDYAAYRQRYLARQRAMQSAAGDLRGRLRDRLAAKSADMARLAEVDAAMELALSPREQALLAAVPCLLESHFETLRLAALADASTIRSSWLDVFCKDMQSVLLAELDVRFQPVEGLLAALRTC